MKKIIIVLLAVLFLSLTYTNEETMLYDNLYNNNELKALLTNEYNLIEKK